LIRPCLARRRWPTASIDFQEADGRDRQLGVSYGLREADIRSTLIGLHGG
jgi:hypothetical protein